MPDRNSANNPARQRFLRRLVGDATPGGNAGAQNNPDNVWARMMATPQDRVGAPANVRGIRTTPGSSFPKLEDPSPDDIANGNYVKVGFRHLLRHDPSKAWFHSYVHIPVMENGKATSQFESYGVLGDPGGSKNQQVRKDDKGDDDKGNKEWKNDRNSQMPDHKGYQGREIKVKVSPEQREMLRGGMQYFTQTDGKGNFIHPCPVCGPKYHKLGPNSNEFIYNMLFWNPAGPIPAPKPPIRALTPAYYRNDPNEQWYPTQTSPPDQQ